MMKLYGVFLRLFFWYLQVSLNVVGYLQHVLRLHRFDLLPQEGQGEDGRLKRDTHRSGIYISYRGSGVTAELTRLLAAA